MHLRRRLKEGRLTAGGCICVGNGRSVFRLPSSKNSFFAMRVKAIEVRLTLLGVAAVCRGHCMVLAGFQYLKSRVATLTQME